MGGWSQSKFNHHYRHCLLLISSASEVTIVWGYKNSIIIIICITWTIHHGAHCVPALNSSLSPCRSAPSFHSWDQRNDKLSVLQACCRVGIWTACISTRPKQQRRHRRQASRHTSEQKPTIQQTRPRPNPNHIRRRPAAEIVWFLFL